MAATQELLDQQVGQLSALFGINATGKNPGGSSAQQQAWNIGQINQQLVAKYGNHAPSIADIEAQAAKMFPGYATFSPAEHQIAQQMANVALMTTNYGSAANIDVTATPTGNLASPTLDADIRQNFGYEAWMLDIPELRPIVEQATLNHWGPDVIQGKLEATNWWRTTSDAQRAFVELQANSPAELDFNNPGSQAAQALATITNQATSLGLTQADPARLKELALQSIQFKMSSQQIAQALSSEIHYSGSTASPSPTNNAAPAIDQVKQSAANYLQNPSAAAIQQYAQQIAAGSLDSKGLDAIFADQAKSRYSWLAPQIDAGQTLSQIVDPMKQHAASLLERDPNVIDFQTDPLFNKVLDYVPQGETQHRMMTQSEMDTYLRSDPNSGYSKTQAARDLVGNTVSNLLQTWGKIK